MKLSVKLQTTATCDHQFFSGDFAYSPVHVDTKENKEKLELFWIWRVKTLLLNLELHHIFFALFFFFLFAPRWSGPIGSKSGKRSKYPQWNKGRPLLLIRSLECTASKSKDAPCTMRDWYKAPFDQNLRDQRKKRNETKTENQNCLLLK